jgi:hypothetical protein
LTKCGATLPFLQNPPRPLTRFTETVMEGNTREGIMENLLHQKCRGFFHLKIIKPMRQ